MGKTREICAVAFDYLVSVQDQLWAINMTLILALFTQIFEYFFETFFRRALGCLKPDAFKINRCFPTETPDQD